MLLQLKYELREAEQDCWNGADGLREHVAVEDERKVARDKASFTVGQGVANEEPLDSADDQ